VRGRKTELRPQCVQPHSHSQCDGPSDLRHPLSYHLVGEGGQTRDPPHGVWLLGIAVQGLGCKDPLAMGEGGRFWGK